MPKNNAGRKTVMTFRVLDKLAWAFSIGCSDREACLFAGINPSTLYDHQNKYPQFSEQKQLLKTKPIFQARMTIVKHLDDPKIAMWYLERKRKVEFSKYLITQNYHDESTHENPFTEEELKKIDEKIDETIEIMNPK